MEFKSTLQTKNEQVSKLTQTMSIMLERVDNLQAQITRTETQAPPNPETLSCIGFPRDIPQSQSFGNPSINCGMEP